MYCCDAHDCTGGADGGGFESTDLSKVREHEEVCANLFFHHTHTSTECLVYQQSCPMYAKCHADTTEPAVKRQKATGKGEDNTETDTEEK